MLYLPYSCYFHPKIIILNSLWLPPRFPPNLPTRMYLWFPPKQYLKQYPLNFLLNSQSQFLLLILFLVFHFIFWYCLFLVISISVIFVLLSSKNYHFELPLVASKVSPKSSNKAVSMIPPKAVLKAVSSKFLTKKPISVPTYHLVVTLSLYIFGIVFS